MLNTMSIGSYFYFSATRFASRCFSLLFRACR